MSGGENKLKINSVPMEDKNSSAAVDNDDNKSATQWQIRKAELAAKKSHEKKQNKTQAQAHGSDSDNDDNNSDEFSDDENVVAGSKEPPPDFVIKGRLWRRHALSNDVQSMRDMLAEEPDFNINLTNRNGQIALMGAASRGHVEAVEFLLSLPKLDINLLSHKNQSALTGAIVKKKSKIVELLLARPELDVSHITVDNKSPYELAFIAKLKPSLQQAIIQRECRDRSGWKFPSALPLTPRQMKERSKNLNDYKALQRIAQSAHSQLLSNTPRTTFLHALSAELVNFPENSPQFASKLQEFSLFLLKQAFDIFAEYSSERKSAMNALKADITTIFARDPVLSSQFTTVFCAILQFLTNVDKEISISTKRIAAVRKFLMGIMVNLPVELCKLTQTHPETFISAAKFNENADKLLNSAGITNFLDIVTGLKSIFTESYSNLADFTQNSFKLSDSFIETSIIPELLAKKQFPTLLKLYFLYFPQFSRIIPLEFIIKELVLSRDYALIEQIGAEFPSFRPKIVSLMLKPAEFSEISAHNHSALDNSERKLNEASSAQGVFVVDQRLVRKSQEFIKLWALEITEEMQRNIDSAIELAIVEEFLDKEKIQAALDYAGDKAYLLQRVQNYILLANIDVNNLPEGRGSGSIDIQQEKLQRKLNKHRTIIYNSNSTAKPVLLPEEMQSKIKFVDETEKLLQMRADLEELIHKSSCSIHVSSSVSNDNHTAKKASNAHYHADCTCAEIGIDFEWRTPRPLSLLQFATSSAIYLVDALVIDSDAQFSAALHSLIGFIFSEQRLLKVGFSFHSDLSHLSKVWAEFRAEILVNFVDLQQLVRLLLEDKAAKVLKKKARKLQKKLAAENNAGPSDEKEAAVAVLDSVQKEVKKVSPTYSLARLIYELSGLILDKAQTTSNWDRRPLSAAQTQYASLDAYILLRTLHQLRFLQKFEAKRIESVCAYHFEKNHGDQQLLSAQRIEEVEREWKKDAEAVAIDAQHPILSRPWLIATIPSLARTESEQSDISLPDNFNPLNHAAIDLETAADLVAPAKL
jgi:ankyrin repeat protein